MVRHRHQPGWGLCFQLTLFMSPPPCSVCAETKAATDEASAARACMAPQRWGCGRVRRLLAPQTYRLAAASSIEGQITACAWSGAATSIILPKASLTCHP